MNTINNLPCKITKSNWAINGDRDDSITNIYGIIIDDSQADTGIVTILLENGETQVDILCIEIVDNNGEIIQNKWLNICKDEWREELDEYI